MDKKKIALIVVVLFLLIGLGSFVFANPDQDNDLEGPGVSEDGGSGDGEVIDGTEPTATPEEENDDSATETDPITTYGNGGNGTGTGAGNGGTTGAGNNGTTGGVGNTDMSQYNDARRIIEELENRVNSMQNKDDSNAAVDYRTETDIIEMVNNLPEGTEKDELMNRLDAINKVLDDTTAPDITGINNGDVTKENVTINVTDDNDVTFTATLDGEEIEFTTPLTEEGHYVVTVTDKNFNTTTVEFTIDKTPIALDWLYVLNNSGTDYKVIGDGQKLYVELVFSEQFTSTPMIQIGNAEAVEMSCHWTNWQTEKQYFKCDATITIDGSTMGLENGKEVPVKITNVLDAAGNETVLTNENITETEKYGHVIYDKQAPEYEQLGIVDHVEWQDEVARAYAKLGDEVRVMIYFKELLAVNPTVKLGGKEFTATHRPDSDQNGLYAYYADIVLTKDMNLAEGIIPFEVYGYADEAGNVGVELTQDMTTSKEYPYVIYDSVAPVLNFNNGFITDAFTVVATDDNFDYMTVQYYDGREMKTITENTFTLDAEGDNIHYNIKAYDKAGNVSAYADIYLDTQAPVLSGTGINGKNEVEVKDGGYYKNATIHFEDGSLKKVVLVNEDGTEEVLEEYKDNYTTAKMVFNRTFTEDGTYTIKAIDRKGNETVVTFTIDNVEPGPRVVGITGFFNEAEGADAHYITTGESVRILTYYDEKLGTAPMVKIGNKEFQTYYAEQSSSEENGSYAYYADIKITQDLGLSDGEIQFSIHGHKDAAGNEGRAYTNADVTYTESSPYEIRYDKVILDNTAPEFNVTSGTHSENTMEITITDDNYNYAKIVNQDNGVSENVDKPTFTLQQEATYHIYAYDKAGNEADLWVAIDNENPTVTVSGIGVDGYYRSEVTIQAFDKFLTSVKVNEDTVDRSSFTSDGRNENFSYETTVSEEGTYTVTATDKYGHSSTEYTFVIDKTMPVVQGAVDGGLYNTPVTLTVIEENLQNAEYQKDGGDWVSFESGTVLDQDGTYFVRVTDKADNEKAELTFTIDQTDPVVKAANILVDGDVNEQIEFYATTGDTIYSYVRFNEELKELPKFYLVNNGTEYEMSDVAVSGPNVNGEYTYSIRYTITDETTMADGQIEMKVTGISDKAGNTIDDITKPTNVHIVYLDRQAPEKTWLYVLNVTDENNRQLIGNGQTLRVELNTTEELAELPVLTIGNSQSVEFRYRGSFDYGYIYVADLKIDQTIANLIDNEVIPFTVTNIVDKAGNVIETVQLDNDDVTYTSNYGQVTFDGVAPKINVTTLNDEGYSNDQTLHVRVVDRNQMTIVITNAAGEVVKTDGCVQGSDGYWSAYDLTNEISVDGTYTVIATDAVGNKSTTTFTVDREAPKFDLSAIPTTFTIGKDIYQYPQPGVVTDNIDGNISFGEVHMNWYHKNADDTKGESTQCFGGDNWNTSLTSCEPGDYIITYRVSDKAGNETSVEQTMTLVKEVVDNEKPVIKGVETNNDYSETRVLEIYDNSGFVTIYFDYDNGYTSPTELRENVKPLNKINATEDKPWSIQIPAAKGLSVYVVDEAGKEAFVTRVTIGQ